MIESAEHYGDHGKRNPTINALNEKYANVTKECLKYDFDLCQIGHEDKGHPRFTHGYN